MSQTRLYEFGPYRIDVGLSRLERAGRPIALPPKAFDLLLLLAQNHHRVVSKGELMETLWPKTFVEDANLTQHVYTLRKALGDRPNGDPYIALVARRGYRLAVEVQEIDLEQHPAAAGLKSTPADALPSAEAPTLILESERKPATVLHCSLANAAGVIERLGPAGLHEVMRQLFALAADEVGRYGGVISERHTDGFVAVFGAPAVHEDDARRTILAALALQNRFRDATRADESDTQQLDLQMGVNTGLLVISRVADERHVEYTAVGETMRRADILQQFAEPGAVLISETTRRAVETFIRLDPVRIPSLVDERAYRVVGLLHSQSAPQPRRTRAAFIGRQREIAMLDGLLAQVLAGNAQVVSIVGEPGIGKSRLVDEFVRTSVGGEESPRVLEGRCVSYGGLIPYLPVADLVRELSGVSEADPPDTLRQAISSTLRENGLSSEAGTWLLPLVGVIDNARALASLSPEAVKARTFDVLRLLFLKAAARHPLIVVVEDVHWIDSTSEEFLTTLAGRLAGARAMLLMTHRPGCQAPWINRSYASQITLAPFTVVDSTRIVEAVAGAEALSAEAANGILTRGEGNPLFLEELARTVIELGSSTDAIPATVRGVIMARIDRLATLPKQLLQTASVLGREVPVKLLRGVWNGPSNFDADLIELCRLEFLYERAGANEPTYVFKHALTQDVAYDSLLTRQRSELHLRAASALKELAADRLDEVTATLAYHYARTDLVDDAVTWLARAADQAAAVYANAEAILYLDLAARRLQRVPEGPDRDRRILELALRHAHSLYFLGRFRESVDVLLPHEAAVARLNGRALTAAYSFWLAHMYSRLGDQRRAGDLARRAIAAATAIGDQATLGKAHGVLSLEGHWAGRPVEGIEHGNQSVRLLASQPDQRWWLGMAHFYLAINHLLEGNFKATLAEAARAEATGAEIGDPRLQTYAGYAVGWAEASRGHYEAAVARCRRSLEQAPDRVSRAYASLFLGFALLEKGDHEPARALLEPMASELDAFGLPQWHALAATLTGESLRLDKRIDEGAAFVERGIQVATRAGYTYAIAFAQRAAARLARDRGCADEASGKCQQALDTFDDSGAVFEAARTRLDLAEIAFEQKDTSRASRELTRAARAFEGLGEKTYRDRTVMLAAKLGLERALLPSRRKH